MQNSTMTNENWGIREMIVEAPDYSVYRNVVLPGESFEYSPKQNQIMHLYVLSGSGRAVSGPDNESTIESNVEPEFTFDFPVGDFVNIFCNTDSKTPLVYIEIVKLPH
jgi:mannose-6-phosphate isomerase-like protein (cupin superfamily)